MADTKIVDTIMPKEIPALGDLTPQDVSAIVEAAIDQGRALEAAAPNFVDQLAGAVAKIGDGIAEAATEYGPGAVDLVLGVVRVRHAGELLFGFIELIALIGMIWGAKIAYKFSNNTAKDKESRYAAGFVVVISLGGSTIASFACLANLGDIWNWVGLFWPELSLAHDALEKVMSPK